MNLKRFLSNILGYAFYFTLLVYQIYNIFFIGTYKWSIQADVGKKMLKELVIISLGILLINFCVKSRWKWLFGCFLLLVMGYLHQTIFPIVGAGIYFCVIILTGYLLLSCLVNKQTIRKNVFWLMSLIMGLCAVCICIALLSIFNIYSIRHIWYVLLGTSGLCLAIKRKELCLDFFQIEQKEGQNGYASAFLSYIEISLFIQLARVGLQGDYDGLWYGFRSESVLAVSSQGIYENLQLVGLTYLYPKGFETILLPLVRFSSWNYQFLFNVLLVIVIVVITWYLVNELTNKNIAYVITAVVATIPSLMNMAMTVKPDVVTVLFQLAGLYFMYLSYKDDNARYIYMSLTCLVVTYCFKITSLLFTSSFIIALIPFIDFKRLRTNFRSIGVFLIGVLTLFLIWGRTLILTGSPLIVYIGGLLEAFGIKIKYPYAMNNNFYGSPTESGSVWMKILDKLFGYFVLPTREEFMHIIIAWGTSIPIILLLLAVVVFVISKEKIRAHLRWIWLMSVMVISMLIGMALLGQADGNYFLLFYILFIVIPGSFLLQHNKDMIVLMYIAAVYNLFFTSFTNWSCVTGFTEIKLNNCGYINQQNKYTKLLKKTDGKKIYSVLREKNAKVLAITWGVEKMVAIEGIAELWFDIERGNGGLLTSSDSLYEYLSVCKFDHIYLDKQNVAINSIQADYIGELIMSGAVDDIIYGKSSAIVELNPVIESGNYENMLNEFVEFMQQ